MPSRLQLSADVLALNPELAAADLSVKAPPKFSNRIVRADGYTFDSAAEHSHYQILKTLERAGAIDDLEVHPRYPLVVNDVRVGIYEADFVYREDGKTVVVDVKGARTAVYVMKHALMLALYQIEIVEVKA